MVGGISVADMTHRVFDVEVQYPIEFEAVATEPL